MIRISILTLKNAVLASIADAANVFATVNGLLKGRGMDPIFEVRLVGLRGEGAGARPQGRPGRESEGLLRRKLDGELGGRQGEVSLNGGAFVIRPDAVTEEVGETDLIIIPSMTADAAAGTYLNKDFAPWISARYKSGAEVASLCTGAFLLAFTGLLRDRQCTTHWAYANEFRYYYPDIDLVDEKVLTHQHGLYSSGGNNAYWNLLLYLVEKYTNREIAIQTAKFFVIDLDRRDQSLFIIFSGQKNHGDEVILKAQEFIERNYAGKMTVDQIADKFNVSRRTFERRFKKATRNTVVEYIQRVKVEATKKQLEIGRKPIHEVMEDVGYLDVKTFRDVFKKITGVTPNEYRSKYNKE